MVRPASAAGSAAGSSAQGELRETYIRSLMGPQAESRKETAPSYGFGTGDRSGALIAPAEGKRAVGLSPGPIYLPSPRATMREGPRFSMSGAPANIGGRRAGAAPGPGEYEPPPSIGQDQGVSYQKTSPRYGWGTSGRKQAPIGSAPRAACGEFYEVPASMGAQPTKRTNANYTFGGASRFEDVQKRRERAAAPGPGAYKAVCGSGAQVDSTKPTLPIYGFARAERFRGRGVAAGNTPELNSGHLRPAVGPQVVSTMRSKPQFGFGSAKRFSDRPSSAHGEPGPGSYNA